MKPYNEFKDTSGIPEVIINETSGGSTNVYAFRERKHLNLIRASISNHADFVSQQKLIDLIRDVEIQMDIAREKGLNPLEISEIRENLPATAEIRTLIKLMGIAKMNTAGDWLVNRKKEIPESMAVAPFSKLLEYFAEFYLGGNKENTKSKKDPRGIKEPELIAVDFGCGNGEFCNELRSDPDNPSVNSWEIFGYADYIYFTLNDFLKSLLAPKYQNVKSLNEFLDIVSTLLLRKLHYAKSYHGSKTYREQILEQLPENLEVIRSILPHLEDYIDLRNRESLHVDIEFLSDSIRQIPKDVVLLMKEYCENPEKFLEKYFSRDIHGLTESDAERLGELEREIEEIGLIIKERKSNKNVTRSFKRVPLEAITGNLPGFPDKSKEKLAELEKEKQELLAQVPDLSKKISISPYNIIPGKFHEIGDFFPEFSVHFAWSFRATSHLDDVSYYSTIYNISRTLAPGGVLFEDGKKESWTRFERLEKLESLAYSLGDEYRVSVIHTGQKANVVLIERGIMVDIDVYEFFSNKYKEKIIQEGSEMISIIDWRSKLPQINVRNKVLKVLREVLVKNTDEGITGRMNFKDVHPFVEDELSKIFSGEAWRFLVESEAAVDSHEIEVLSASIAERIKEVLLENTHLSIRNLFVGEAVPVNPDLLIQTFPRPYVSDMDHIQINIPRVFPVSSLPRNKDIPSREIIQKRADTLMGALIALKDKFKKPPVRIVKFDQCFTNQLLTNAVRGILEDSAFNYGVDILDYIDVSHLQLQSGFYSKLNEAVSPILIIGGSIDDAFDQGGQMFTNKICRKLLEEIENGSKQRIIGICFGSQVLLQAFGQMKGLNFKTLSGALQYGAFPVSFADSNDELKELSGNTYSLGMTRGSYSITTGYEKLGDTIKPLAFETTYKRGNLIPNTNLPPLAFSLFGGKVITSQFHPEIPLTNMKAATALEHWLLENHSALRNTYDDSYSLKTGSILQKPLNSPHYLFTQHFNPMAEGSSGPEPWFKNEAGLVFLLNTLLMQAKSLL